MAVKPLKTRFGGGNEDVLKRMMNQYGPKKDKPGEDVTKKRKKKKFGY